MLSVGGRRLPRHESMPAGCSSDMSLAFRWGYHRNGICFLSVHLPITSIERAHILHPCDAIQAFALPLLLRV